jgi:non-ribosomal peptide synthetase-like protein
MSNELLRDRINADGDNAYDAVHRGQEIAKDVLGLAGPEQARTLVDIFRSSLARWPDNTALDDGTRRLTYRQLAAEAGHLADRLTATGVGRGDRVGIRVPSGGAALYTAVLGTLLAGAVYVPVEFSDPDSRAELVWREAGPCAVIGPGLSISERLHGRARRGAPRPSDDCWVIFTSGSTGAPKGVAVTHRAAAAFVDAEASLWTVHSDDRVLAGLSVSFDASCEEMWMAWRNGAALVPCPRHVVQSGLDLGPWLRQHDVTVVSTVPTLAAMWDDEVVAGVRLLVLGGEACPTELGWRLAVGREVWNTYGPTEATVVSTAARVRPGQPITIGLPLPGWEVAVVDEAGTEVPEGQEGELVIAGVGLGRYLDRHLDAQKYAGLPHFGWSRAYHTGDMVRWGPDGLEFRGRRDDQVKLGGRRVELAEIDTQLCAVPGVRAAAAAVRQTGGQNSVLVGYVVGEVSPEAVRAHLVERLPAGMVPIIVAVPSLPTKSSGKVDRKALPWPPPRAATRPKSPANPAGLSGTEAWLAERWADQLGPLPMTAESDFFELGGSSLGVARLVSVLRERFPATAVADVYNHRRLGQLAERLDHLGEVGGQAPEADAGSRLWGALQLAGVLALVVLASAQWLVGLLAYDQWDHSGVRIGWAALIVAWLAVSSAPGRAAMVALARRALLGRLQPGRYPRHGWLSCRVWFLERLTAAFHLEALAGTPWTARYARLFGAHVGAGARLRTLPSPASLVHIGEGASVEADVDLRGWWVEGRELVIGEVRVGAGARIGARTVLMPGAVVGDLAEVEPGSVVSGTVPAGELWSGSPARKEGRAGDSWPATDAFSPPPAMPKALYAFGLALLSSLPLLAAVPEIAIVGSVGSISTSQAVARSMCLGAPLLAATFVVSYALLTALVIRSVAWLVRPGWHSEASTTVWALWLSSAVLGRAQSILFPLFMSVYTRPWLRLVGFQVGKGTEISTSGGLTPLVTFASTSFAADEVFFAGMRARGGLVEVAPIEVGNRSFLGNGAVLRAGTRVGDDSLVGALSCPPRHSVDGTSWFGHPALEFPRVPETADPARTTAPSRRLVVARGAMELLRILLPATISIALGATVFSALEDLGSEAGALAMICAAPVVVLLAGLGAVAFTILAKWSLIGRYRAGKHPFWSFFVWRDEVLNTCQEQLAGAWLMSMAIGTPLVPAYLRAMGARVGKGVWFETLAITEFDLVTLGDSCAVNRGACVETHLFHDRLLNMGPAVLGAGSTLGPSSAVLPDTVLGEGCSVGARSVVLRGEHLPALTSWHGAPVQAR